MIDLKQVPGAEAVGPFALTLAGALSNEDCQAIIDCAGERLEQSGLLGTQRENYRTSSGAWLRPNDLPEQVGKLRGIVSDITGLPATHQESVQVLRYEVGQEYREHQDFWHPNTDYYDAQMERGGQRSWSVMVYLNTVEGGGGTGFPKLGLAVEAEEGKLLAWQNTIDGELNYDSLHAGLPVTAGRKWVAVTWVREQPFT